MADWVIAQPEDSVVLTYVSQRGAEWSYCLSLVSLPLEEVVAWITAKNNPAAGDRIILPGGGVLFARGVAGYTP